VDAFVMARANSHAGFFPKFTENSHSYGLFLCFSVKESEFGSAITPVGGLVGGAERTD
jgi:hypothetical protein